MNPNFRRSLPRTLFFIVTAGAAGFWYWSDWVSKSPLVAPIDITRPVLVEQTIQLRVPQPYELSFEFTRGAMAHEKVAALVGEMDLCGSGPNCGKGIPLEVEWSLSNPDTHDRVVGSRVTTHDASGFSNLEVWRRVAEFNVAPGNYRLKVAVHQPAPELAALNPAIRVSLYPKDTTSWQMFAVWWGTLLLPFVVLPVALLSAYLWFRSAR